MSNETINRHAACTAELDRLRTLLHETTVERDDAREQVAAMSEREALSSPAELARWIEIHHGDHQEWVDELIAMLPRGIRS